MAEEPDKKSPEAEKKESDGAPWTKWLPVMVSGTVLALVESGLKAVESVRKAIVEVDEFGKLPVKELAPLLQPLAIALIVYGFWKYLNVTIAAHDKKMAELRERVTTEFKTLRDSFT